MSVGRARKSGLLVGDADVFAHPVFELETELGDERFGTRRAIRTRRLCRGRGPCVGRSGQLVGDTDVLAHPQLEVETQLGDERFGTRGAGEIAGQRHRVGELAVRSH